VSDVVTSERHRLQHSLDQQRNAVLEIIDGTTGRGPAR